MAAKEIYASIKHTDARKATKRMPFWYELTDEQRLRLDVVWDDLMDEAQEKFYAVMKDEVL